MLTLTPAVRMAAQDVARDSSVVAGRPADNVPSPMPSAKELKKAEQMRKAQEKAQARAAKKAEQEARDAIATDNDVVYVFGVGTNFNDSVVYLSDIIELRKVKLNKKTKFLPFRSEYSSQLKEYLEATYGMVNETTCVFFSTKRKKLSKRFYKLKKRYLDLGTSALIVLDKEQFSFTTPEFDNVAF